MADNSDVPGGSSPTPGAGSPIPGGPLFKETPHYSAGLSTAHTKMPKGPTQPGDTSVV